jgi:hypothetical protein
MGKSEAKPYGFKYQAAMIELGSFSGLKSGPQTVLKALLKYCNGTSGQARPGKKELSIHTGQGERTIQRHLGTLREVGLIEAIAYADGGFECATCYTFTLPQWSTPRVHGKTAKMALLKELKGANLSPKGAILALKGSQFGHPTKNEQRRTSGDASAAERNNASRIEKGPEAGGASTSSFRARRMDELLQNMTYGEAKYIVDQEEALRAAGD